MTNMPIQMHEKAAVVGKEFAEEYDGFVEPFEVAVEAFAPGVAVGLLLDDARLLDERYPATAAPPPPGFLLL